MELYAYVAACYPYYQEDPFIISECPDIYFAGNQPHFQTKLYEGR
jgi:DNA polymerase delta subunit 2